MVKLNPLALLAILELLLVFIVLAIVFFLQHRKKCLTVLAAQKEIRELKVTIEDLELEIKKLRAQPVEAAEAAGGQEPAKAEQDEDKDIIDELRKKFGHIKESNDKVRESINTLVQESGDENKHGYLIVALDQNQKELQMCIETLKHENLKIKQQKENAENKLAGMSGDINNLVAKAEHDSVVAEKNRLELRAKKYEDTIQEKDAAIEKLEKEYSWLEKEYNALYENTIKEQG